MMGALDKLRAGLAASFAELQAAPEAWSAVEEMARARQRVRDDHGGAGIAVDPRSILDSVEQFRKSRVLESFRELKYVCLGIGALDRAGWSVLADEGLRSTVARSAEQQAAVHRRARCFQALLSSYFAFPVHGEAASAESSTGWRGLRGWLRAERDEIAELFEFAPPWFEALLRHPELLTNRPCDKFGAELLSGNAAGLSDAKSSLSIAETSWVIEEAALAQMRAANALADDEFKGALPKLVAIAMGRAGVSMSASLSTKCVAILVSRYARCVDRPEQPELRDAAVSTIGNPWLRRVKWDAWVRVDGETDDRAREMVFFWLKERLVEDFFELLSVDGVNDRRRVAYWLRFVPFVDDMWFALGSNASTRSGGQFKDFRERARGRLLNLEGTTPDNNAFVMRIGAYLAVEFGSANNSFFLFRWDALDDSVVATLESGRNSARIHINDLKSPRNVAKISHRDSPAALKSWEQKFDDDLNKLIGVTPETRPACVPALEALLVNGQAKVADLRAAGGALWVDEDGLSFHLAKKLRALNFTHRPGRGWFKE